MPSINDEKNAEHQQASRDRRAACYLLVKQMALQAGYMKHPRDAAGLDRFLNDHPIDGDNIDWFESMTELLSK